MHLFQGRIHQIEYAMEAVKQGSATVGLKSGTHAVLVALKVFPSNIPVQELHRSFAETSGKQYVSFVLTCYTGRRHEPHFAIQKIEPEGNFVLSRRCSYAQV